MANPWFTRDGFAKPEPNEPTQTESDARREYLNRRIERLNASIAEHTRRSTNTDR